MAQQTSQRPSAFLALENTYVAFCFDEACLAFGAAVEAAIGEVESKNERAKAAMQENVLRKYIGLPMKFRDAMDLVRRKQEAESDRPEPPFPKE